MIVLHDQERIGRRWSDVIFIGTNAVFLGVAAIFSNHAEDDLTSQWTVTAMCLLAKMNSAASFCVVYAHTVEIFPTSIRHYLYLILIKQQRGWYVITWVSLSPIQECGNGVYVVHMRHHRPLWPILCLAGADWQSHTLHRSVCSVTVQQPRRFLSARDTGSSITGNCDRGSRPWQRPKVFSAKGCAQNWAKPSPWNMRIKKPVVQTVNTMHLRFSFHPFLLVLNELKRHIMCLVIACLRFIWSYPHVFIFD